jgi:hypothetical protein
MENLQELFFQTTSVDREIDALVYTLYGLTEVAIKILEQ